MSTASPETIANLNAAFQGESNASHKYALYAKKADEEGYAYEARLFRAASRAEAIHANNHRKTILALGGVVDQLILGEVKIGPTAANIQDAINGETHEFKEMYPEFIAVAEKDGCKEALRTMNWAMKVEIQHAALYQAALDNLGKNADKPFYVCAVCGETVTELPEKCSVCNAAAKAFEAIA